jgi:hypothetical protein
MRGRLRQDPNTRFFSYVKVMPLRCWEWSGELDRKGFPFFFDGKRRVRAHRYSYETFCGPIPAGLDVLRKCHNKTCVNPMHLIPGIHDQLARARQQLAKTHCPRGHEYSEENTYYYINALGNQARLCKTCVKARDRAKYQKIKCEVTE